MTQRDTPPCSTTFFLGAGISIESGFPAARSLIDQIISRIAPDADSLTELRALVDPPLTRRRAAGDYLRFELLLDVLVDQVDPHLSILDFISEVRRPNPIHFLLAARGCCGDILVTTNFDTLLEQAILILGGRPRTRCRKADFRETPADGVPIYKLHGSYSTFDDTEDSEPAVDTIQATLAALAGSSFRNSPQIPGRARG